MQYYYNIGQNGFPSEAITLQAANSKYLWITGRKVMTGNLNMGNDRIINLTNPTDNSDATNKSYVDTHFLKLSGGDITGIVSKDTQSTMFDKSLLNYEEVKFWFVEKGNPYVRARFNIILNQVITTVKSSA